MRWGPEGSRNAVAWAAGCRRYVMAVEAVPGCAARGAPRRLLANWAPCARVAELVDAADSEKLSPRGEIRRVTPVKFGEGPEQRSR